MILLDGNRFNECGLGCKGDEEWGTKGVGALLKGREKRSLPSTLLKILEYAPSWHVNNIVGNVSSL